LVGVIQGPVGGLGSRWEGGGAREASATPLD
jgi:hypothetical protein